jgi:hypothetical protein
MIFARVSSSLKGCWQYINRGATVELLGSRGKGMRHLKSLAMIASLAISIVGARSQAATISVALPNSDDQNATVTVEGMLSANDSDQFQAKTSALSKAIVVLRSEGGSVVARIKIGEAIRLKGFSTLVVERCASACAIAWLGGTQRFMAAGARIGFHAAFDPQSRQETGVGNAVIGAYLNRIGLPYAAVVYITAAAPTSMTWLTISDAKRNGIDVTLLNVPVPTAVVPPSVIQPHLPSDTAGNQPAVPDGQRTFWDHNGSLVYLEADGAGRRFYYQQPRPGMTEVGARPGALLFDGQSAGGNYFGTAYIFNRRCGRLPYHVQGPILEEGRRVKMIGQGPRVDQKCNIPGYLEDVLEFKLAP